MGTFYTGCKGAYHTHRKKSIHVGKALVDTGNEYTWIPGKKLGKSGVQRKKKDLRFVIANGEIITRSVGFAIMYVHQREINSMNITSLIVTLLFISIILMVGGFALAKRLNNAGLVDLGWTLGLGLSAPLYFVLIDGYGPRQILVSALTLMWSLRLGFYVLRDRVLSGKEDARYQKLKAHWGHKADKNLFLFL